MTRVKRLVLTALFAACSFAVNAAESALPMPLPGVKLGAANIFALAALVLLGVKEAFSVTLARIFLAWLAGGNWFAFLCSLGGGLPSTALTAFLYKRFGAEMSLPWISVAGAWAFNAGQLAVVSYLVSGGFTASYVLAFAPPLFAAGTAAGWAVGWLACRLLDRLGRRY